jgi:hypothetical protein
MGKISDMFQNYAAGFAQNNKESIFGIPSSTTGTGTGGGGTGPGCPPPESLTKQQRFKLEEFFHKEYGRFPASEYEFQQWLKHNW